MKMYVKTNQQTLFLFPFFLECSCNNYVSFCMRVQFITFFVLIILELIVIMFTSFCTFLHKYINRFTSDTQTKECSTECCAYIENKQFFHYFARYYCHSQILNYVCIDWLDLPFIVVILPFA